MGAKSKDRESARRQANVRKSFRSPLSYPRISTPEWCKAAGACAVFISWVIQNMVLADLDAERLRIHEHAVMAAINETKVIQSIFEYTRATSANPRDVTVIGQAAANFAAQATQSIIIGEEVLRDELGKDTINEATAKRLQAEILEAVRSQDVPKILAIATQLSSEYTNVVLEQRAKILKKLENTTRHGRSVRRGFLAAYCMSGALFVLGWWFTERDSTPKST